MRGRRGSPLKRNKFCRGEVRGPSSRLCKSSCFMDGLRREVGDGPALVTRAISPTYICLNFGMFRKKTTSSWKPLELLSLIYCRHYYSKLGTAAIEGEHSKSFIRKTWLVCFCCLFALECPASWAPMWAFGYKNGSLEIASILEVTFHTRRLLSDPKFLITSGPRTLLLLFVALTDLST